MLKKNSPKFLAILLIFLLTMLSLPGLGGAEGSLTGKPSLNVRINLASLANQEDLAGWLYEEIYQQVKTQLGSRYMERTIEQISSSLLKVLLPQLEKMVSQRTPSKEQLEPGREPEPVPEPDIPLQPALPVPPVEVTPTRPDKESYGLTRDEALMLELINQERVKAGLKSLKIHPELTETARLKGQDMVNNNYFSHYSPVYGSPFQMMTSAGIRYSYAGENLAGAPTVERAHQALMNSPGHRANILNPNFTHIGIGVVESRTFGKIFVQMFIRPL